MREEAASVASAEVTPTSPAEPLDHEIDAVIRLHHRDPHVVGRTVELAGLTSAPADSAIAR